MLVPLLLLLLSSGVVLGARLGRSRTSCWLPAGECGECGGPDATTPCDRVAPPACSQGQPPCALPDAPQQVYIHGVPHTDRHGNKMMEYDAAKSFLPVALWDPQLDCSDPPFSPPPPADKLGAECLPTGFDNSLYTGAGYNTVLVWKGFDMTYMNAYSRAGIQVIRQRPEWDGMAGGFPKTAHDDIRAYKDHPALLGWMLDEEPTGEYWAKNMSGKFLDYQANYKSIKAIDPVHPVFPLDCPWIAQPATEWWKKWNSAGDVSAHDNYAFDFRATSLATINGDGGGIDQTVGLAASINNESKPVWLTVTGTHARHSTCREARDRSVRMNVRVCML
eukprot:SAG11_NODE_1573_length_4664_cov_3.235487_2_plen_334_part_00